MSDFDDFVRAADAAAERQSRERLQPIFDLVARLASPTVIPGPDGTWALGVAVDRTDSALTEATAAVSEVINGYFDEYKRSLSRREPKRRIPRRRSCSGKKTYEAPAQLGTDTRAP
jgi:hypothetical protein